MTPGATSTTLNVYAHAVPGGDAVAAEVLSCVLRGAGSESNTSRVRHPFHHRFAGWWNVHCHRGCRPVSRSQGEFAKAGSVQYTIPDKVLFRRSSSGLPHFVALIGILVWFSRRAQ